MQHQRENFLRTYSNLPLNVRDEIILVFEEKPITWDVAYLEVKARSELGQRILKELKELSLI